MVDRKDNQGLAIGCVILYVAATKRAVDTLLRQVLQQLCNRLDAEWIRHVVDNRQLLTYFQPIVSNCVPASIFAYECLLRGITDEGRLIPPLEMISAARETGMLPDLDEAAQLLTIVEGVETQEEWAWTREHGADLAQGDLAARPAPLPPNLDTVFPQSDRLDENDLQPGDKVVRAAGMGCGRSVEP
jgi:EAL domain-containing protein (putative c-di-GMP-specific phosphodiesterase class I)